MKLPKNVTVTKDRTKELMRGLKALTQRQVLVGVPSVTADREPDPADPEPINNATIGYLMENGSPAQNLPARPHLKPGVAAAGSKIAARYKGAANRALSGDTSAIETAHDAVGLIASSAVKAKITEGAFAPLSPRTLAARRRRGRTGEKPLIDTGQYRNSITYVVRDKGK